MENANDDAYDDYDEDACKAFLSRIPSAFKETPLRKLLKKKFGESSVGEVCFSYNQKNRDDGIIIKETEHNGFGFVTFSSVEKKNEAIKIGTVRGPAKDNSKRKYTVYIGPVVRRDINDESMDKKQNCVCFQWQKFRCQYGKDCTFKHEGEGACLPLNKGKGGDQPTKKKERCFTFYKKGECKKGDSCTFSHDRQQAKTYESLDQGLSKECIVVNKSEKNCISWKTKGKCRKGDRCPYKHDEEVRDAALNKQKKKGEKKRQPLSVRVFGLNYETTEEDIRAYFVDCGPITELTFPQFDDSGRSKGFCGVHFQSPKAVDKAVALDGKELHGRWLRIQAGKMYLKQWEEHFRKDDEGEFCHKVKKRKTLRPPVD